MIRFKCGGCGKQYNVPSETAGKQARCKECGVMFHVPVPRSAAAAQSADTPLPARAPLATALNPADSPRPVARVLGGAGPGSMVARADAAAAPGTNLDAFDPYESSPLDDTFGVGYRPRKKSNLGLWVLLGGGGIGVVGMIAAAIMLIINNLPARTAGGSGTAAQAWTGQAFASGSAAPTVMSGDVGVYMPANWSLCASIRIRQFMDRSHLLPTMMQEMDKAFAENNAAVGDMRKVDEALYVLDGQIMYMAMTFNSAAEMAQIRSAGETRLEKYRGLQLYQERTKANPRAVQQSFQQPQVFYFFTPTDRAIVGANDLARLKASIDRAIDGGPSDFAFSRQKTLNVQVKNVRELGGPSAAPGNPLTDGIVGVVLSAELNNQLDLAAVLDMKDAQAASNFQSQVTLAITTAKSQLGSEFSPTLDAIQLSASGNQVHFTGSIPYHLLTKLMQAGQTPLAMPGMPWPQRPMPGQTASGQVPGFTPPPIGGGFQPPYGGSGPFPGAPPGLTGPGMSGRRPGGMRPPTIQPPRVRPPTSRPPTIQPPTRPPRMRPPGRFR